MIFAFGTPVNAQFRPWKYDWALKPDAIMVSAIDFITSPLLFQKIKEKGLREYIDWDGMLVCDSGAFSALNNKKNTLLSIERVKKIYKELNRQDPSLIKITLDFPDEEIIKNYLELHPLEVELVIPHYSHKLIDDLVKYDFNFDWVFIGRLVPLMRKGGGHANRLFPILDNLRKYIKSFEQMKKTKLWALGVGAPSLIDELSKRVEGCDSSRWRITGSNMILLPKGGERGVGNRTKWRGTHHRIADGEEKNYIIKILRHIDSQSSGLESLDKTLKEECYPKQLRGLSETNLPKIGNLLDKLRNNPNQMSVYDLELLLRTSGNLRLIFNYWAILGEF